MYYGNSGASSVSNGTATFEFFDDFNDNSLDTNKWSTYCSGADCSVTETNGELHAWGYDYSHYTVNTTASFSRPYVSRFKWKGDWSGPDARNFYIGRHTGEDTIWNYEGFNYLSFNSFQLGIGRSDSQNHTAPSYYLERGIYKIYELKWVTGYVYGYVYNISANLELITSGSNTTYNNLATPFGFRDYAGSGSNVSQWFDWVLVRKYADPEPTISFGSEEESETAPFSITLNFPPNQTTLYDPTPDFNFTVSGNESSYFCELFINDTGYGFINETLEEDTEDSYSCGENIDSCANAVDEDWDTRAKVDSGASEGTVDYVYENYTIPEGNYVSANWTAKAGCYNAEASTCSEVYYWNYTANDWQKLGDYCNAEITTYQIPSDGLNNTLQIKTQLQKGSFLGIGCHGYRYYWEGKVIWVGVENNTPTIITANQSLSDGTYDWYINCTAGGHTEQSEVREFTRWAGLNISVYYDNGTEATNWNISITNGTDNFSGTYNNSAMLRWNEIPYGEINITIDDGSDTLYYYQNTTNTTNNETNYQKLNFTLTAKGNNTIILTATPSWSITETQQVQITCTAEEGTPRLYMDDTEISNPYTGQPTTGTYTITCNVSSETTNYRPTTKNRTLIVTPPMASCTNNETFAFSTEVTTTTNITTLNFTKFVNQHYVKEDLSDVYVPNVSNVWKNTVNGYYIVVNNTNLSSFTVYFGNYYAYRNYTNHAVSNVKNITLYQQENTYAMFRLLDEVTGEELYPPNTTEVVMYVSCAQGSNYVNIEENDTQFLIAFNSYPTKLLTRVQYSVDTYYSRSLYPSQQKDQYLLSFYLIDAYKYYTDKINFVILSSDYYDAKLQVYKKVSNQTIIITEGYFDKMRTFPAYLLEDHDYYLRLIKDGEIRDVGTFTVTSAGTQYLDVSQVILSPSVSLFADKVTIGAEYNNTTDTIRIQYRDLTDKTINITISVYNNTGLYFQQTYNSSNFTITLNDVPKNQSWYVRYVLYHEIYGNSPITGSVSLIQGILLPIGVATWLYSFISFFILFLTSSIITPRNIIGGMLAIFVLLYLLYYIGWLSLTADAIVVISIILIMGILLHLRSRGEAL